MGKRRRVKGEGRRSYEDGKMGRWGKAKGDDMILVDTSVWIDFLIGRDTPGRSQLFAFELFTAVIAFQLVSLPLAGLIVVVRLLYN